MNNPKEEEEFLLKDQLALTQTDTFHIKFMKLCLLIALLMKHILVVLSGDDLIKPLIQYTLYHIKV